MIKPKFTRQFVNQLVQAKVDNIVQATINRFIRVGLQFVRNARNNGNYNDITGNLRSSIGFIVLNGTKVVYQDFRPAGKRGMSTPRYGTQARGSSGMTEARKAADDAKSRVKLGAVTLIVVAGMDYASAVEARGKDVLTGSSQQAKEDLANALNAIRTKFGF